MFFQEILKFFKKFYEDFFPEFLQGFLQQLLPEFHFSGNNFANYRQTSVAIPRENIKGISEQIPWKILDGIQGEISETIAGVFLVLMNSR